MAKVSGKERVALPDIGPLILNYLSKEEIHNYEDLARVNPYDSKLRFLGEKLVAWVNQARNILAEEAIRNVEVNDQISVTSSKTYDEKLTQKCILARLGMYELYLRMQRRDLPDAYEFVFSINPEHERYALGPWLEYKQNARTYRYILARAEEAPVARPVRQLEYGELLSIFGRVLLDVGQVRLAKELLLHLLFADKLHCLIIGEPSSPAKSSLASLLVKFAVRPLRHVCGDANGGEMLSEKAVVVNPDVIVIENLRSATPDERRVLQEIMVDQGITPNSGESAEAHPIKANIYAYGYPEGEEWRNLSKASTTRLQIAVPTEMLKNFHCVVLAEEYNANEMEKIARSLHSLTAPSQDEVNSVRRSLEAARSLSPDSGTLPESIIQLLTSLNKQRRRLVIPVTFQIERAIIELAKAKARMRMSQKLAPADFDSAIQLMKTSLITCGYLEKVRRH